jgi:hypothetical protein
MSVHPLKRRFLVSAALFLAAAPVFALNPSARTEARMVYDTAAHRMVLFGGVTSVDRGTKQAYDLGDTWERLGNRWIQRFPAHSPVKRAAHIMVYDTIRNHVVLFGGRSGTSALNDTWIYEGDDWKQIATPNSPTPRFLHGGAYDSSRDRLVVFGGSEISADGKTVSPVYDTWEFDGTTWVQKNAAGPKVAKPLLAYDAARNQTIMLGLDEASATVMYAYDAAAATWNQLKPATLPECVNEGAMVYNTTWNNVFYTGGVCATALGVEETMEWDGTNWVETGTLVATGRIYGAAVAYDPDRDFIVMFGGTTTANTTRSFTFVLTNLIWINVTNSTVDPTPRSLYTFVSDPVSQSIWMFGGIDDNQTYLDFWRYRNGLWEEYFTGGEPANCIYPNAAWDTDRNKMVLICNDSLTYEFDSASNWKNVVGSKEIPILARYRSIVYDQTLKKTVIFGGWADNYNDQTFTWDGTNWTRVKKDPPPPRALAAMWYDPTLKKTVMYGGIGRMTSDGRLVRFEDMWTFDGTGWTELKPAGGTPGMRYGAQVAVDPRTNKVVLFGGLRVDVNGTAQTQVYADDTWEWDGTKWTKLAPSAVPPARENARITFDPLRNELVMFSGFAGTYLSDIWTFTDGQWKPRIENVTQRRRSTRQ